MSWLSPLLVPTDHNVKAYNHTMVYHLARAYGATPWLALRLVDEVSELWGTDKLTSSLADRLDAHVRHGAKRYAKPNTWTEGEGQQDT